MKLKLILSTILLFSLSLIRTTGEGYIPKQNTSKSFKKERLIGKWYFWSKDNDSNTKLENVNEGKALIINANGTYTTDVFSRTESGKWYFNTQKQVLTFKHEQGETKWELRNVNEFGLVLINLSTTEKWVFALEG